MFIPMTGSEHEVVFTFSNCPKLLFDFNILTRNQAKLINLELESADDVSFDMWKWLTISPYISILQFKQ